MRQGESGGLGGSELTDGGDGSDDFTELQLVQDGGLSGCVKTDHEDSHLLTTPETVKQPRESDTHFDGASEPGVADRYMVSGGCGRGSGN